ncbi:unnamed protein product [Gongylonema pulchrum]|uniref:diacylglycerol O-acyltransferase n=1 Tax=Gongylonema pulchrum TaxID=637853 RepID=A0A3P7P0R2_9BILA|nr:unnamed protein product [Gongylonema pulchrum]
MFAWLYLVWFYIDYRTPERGGRINVDARNWRLYRYMASYFPVKLIKTADLPANHNYIIGAHPHGILCFGAFLTYATNATGFDQYFPGIRCALATVRAMFWIPIKREQAFYMTGLYQ